MVLASGMACYSKEAVEAAIFSSCTTIGIANSKEKQKAVITYFVEGNDVSHLAYGVRKVFCFALLPLVFDRLRGEKMASVVICVSPLKKGPFAGPEA